ncbi:Gag-like protein [Plakobranchus ocellatus]|uniref:Gag-like protein n=1 Tax=Plakobranchus ocellatus TaxID=259542 RepID=A0AAV4BFP3_9GAST|nr:Gag-like protein [Plakobranchus ocellatus]
MKLGVFAAFLDIPVTVSPHMSLNSSKGVIRSCDLRCCTEEIVEELSGVTHAWRIKKPAVLPRDNVRSVPSAPSKGRKTKKDSPALSSQRVTETETLAKRRTENKTQEAPRKTSNRFVPLAIESEDIISSIWGNSSIPSSPRASASPMECPLSPSKPQPPSKSRPRRGGENLGSSAFLTIFLSLHPRGLCDGEG